MNRKTTGITGTTYTLTSLTQSGVAQQLFTRTGLVEANGASFISPLFEGTETTAPTGIAAVDQLYPDSTLHRWVAINDAGTGSALAQLADFATPPAIGNTTPAAGTFTTMTATTSVLGAATGGSLLLTGIKDGLVPAAPTTQTACTLGTASSGCLGSYLTGYSFNQYATAGTGVTYTLPTAQAGRQYCVANSYNGSAANTGVLEIAASAAAQYIIFTDGTLSASGGNVTSGGAAGDAACVVGVDATHWQLFVQQGTWTKH